MCTAGIVLRNRLRMAVTTVWRRSLPKALPAASMSLFTLASKRTTLQPQRVGYRRYVSHYHYNFSLRYKNRAGQPASSRLPAQHAITFTAASQPALRSCCVLTPLQVSKEFFITLLCYQSQSSPALISHDDADVPVPRLPALRLLSICWRDKRQYLVVTAWLLVCIELSGCGTAAVSRLTQKLYRLNTTTMFVIIAVIVNEIGIWQPNMVVAVLHR